MESGRHWEEGITSKNKLDSALGPELSLREQSLSENQSGARPCGSCTASPSPALPPRGPETETPREEGNHTKGPHRDPGPPPSPVLGTPRCWHCPRPATHLQSSIFGRQVRVVIPAGRDALEEDELGRAVVVSGEEGGPFLGAVVLGGFEAGPEGTCQAQPEQQPQRRGHRGGSAARRGGPVPCLPRQLCLRCRLLINQQLSRKPCPPSLPPLADKTGAFCSPFGGSKACGKERGASAASGCKVLSAPGTAGREGEGAGTGGWEGGGGESRERQKKEKGERLGWMGWVRSSSILAGSQSPPDLAQGDPGRLVLGRRCPHAGITRQATRRPPAVGHKGKRRRETVPVGHSQALSHAASCQSDPLPGITSFSEETEYFSWL